MIKRLILFFVILVVGLFIAVAASAQTCPRIYQGINCGDNWYCGGCVTACPTCPGGIPGSPAGATVLNYMNCACNCPSGQIVCGASPGTCTTPPTCPTPTREQANTCSGCGACKAGYSSDPSAPDAPNPCLKTAYIDYANTGYFQVSGNLKSTGGDLYLASGKAIRIDGVGTTTLSVGNFTGTSFDLSLIGGLVVRGSMALTSQGAGTINAEKLCIQGSCRDVWPAAVSAFVDEGNTGFGPTAVLGTNDNVPLAFEVNNSEKMRIDTAGNVGIGTASPSYKFVISGASPREYIWSTSGNSELDLGDGTNHWAIYRDTATDQLRFWRNDNRVVITSDGNVGIGTLSPGYKLDVAGQINASTSATPAIQGTSSAVLGRGVYGAATSLTGTNYGVYGNTESPSGWGGYFIGGRGVYADKLVAGSPVDPGMHELYVMGTGYFFSSVDTPVLQAITMQDGSLAIYGRTFATSGGAGVYGTASSIDGIGIKGVASGVRGIGVEGFTTAVDGFGVKGSVMAGSGFGAGVYGYSNSPSGYAVSAFNEATSDAAYGIYGRTGSGVGWAGYFLGGKGVFTPQLCLGTEGNCRTDWPAGGGGTIGGSGTANYLAKFTAGTTIGNSLIYDNGASIGIGTTSPGATLDVQGAAQFGSGNVNLIDSTGKIAGISSIYFASLDGSALTNLNLTNLNASNLTSGTVPSARLSGSYTGIAGVGTLTAGTWNASTIGISYGGTGGTASPTAGAVAYGTGSVYAFTAAGASGQFLQSTGAGAPTWATIPASIVGSGSANYLAKFTAGTTVGNSQIIDNGTSVGIGWPPLAQYKLDISGNTYIGGYAEIYGDVIANNNTPSGCAWTAYTASVTCPSGQFITGVRYSASTVSAYCCEL